MPPKTVAYLFCWSIKQLLVPRKYDQWHFVNRPNEHIQLATITDEGSLASVHFQGSDTNCKMQKPTIRSEPPKFQDTTKGPKRWMVSPFTELQILKRSTGTSILVSGLSSQGVLGLLEFAPIAIADCFV
jgi:hypothetical protein